MNNEEHALLKFYLWITVERPENPVFRYKWKRTSFVIDEMWFLFRSKFIFPGVHEFLMVNVYKSCKAQTYLKLDLSLNMGELQEKSQLLSSTPMWYGESNIEVC